MRHPRDGPPSATAIVHARPQSRINHIDFFLESSRTPPARWTLFSEKHAKKGSATDLHGFSTFGKCAATRSVVSTATAGAADASELEPPGAPLEEAAAAMGRGARSASRETPASLASMERDASEFLRKPLETIDRLFQARLEASDGVIPTDDWGVPALAAAALRDPSVVEQVRSATSAPPPARASWAVLGLMLECFVAKDVH